MIINVRGTSGAGKSYLARRLMALYDSRVPNFSHEGGLKPISYLLTRNGGRPLFILGHYETESVTDNPLEAGGGADNVPKRDVSFPLMAEAIEHGCDIFWEGVIYSDEVPLTIHLGRGGPLHVILLTTPIEQCLADIRERRRRTAEARGKQPKELSEKNTVTREAAIQRAVMRLRLAGVKIERLDREAAFLRCAELLGLETVK